MKKVIRLLKKEELSRQEELLIAKTLLKREGTLKEYGGELLRAKHGEESNLVIDSLIEYLTDEHGDHLEEGKEDSFFFFVKEELQELKLIQASIKERMKQKQIIKLVKEGLSEEEATQYVEELESIEALKQAKREVRKERMKRSLNEGIGGFRKLFKTAIGK